jgi:hypothetical protein
MELGEYNAEYVYKINDSGNKPRSLTQSLQFMINTNYRLPPTNFRTNNIVRVLVELIFENNNSWNPKKH